MGVVPRLMLVGLGNAPYPFTRHSVGHVILDSLASRLGLQFSLDRNLKGFVAKTNVTFEQSPVDVILYKPKALMNITGPCVSTALRYTDVQRSSMIVVHDSASHKPKTISPKFGGSAGGHNGVRSIISSLGGDMDFHRIRVGIGRVDGDITEYVLDPLSAEERNFWSSDGPGIELVWKALTKISANIKP